MKKYKFIKSDYQATMIAEGFIETDNQNEIQEAWQYLHDTGLAYQLQGWFARTAQNLLEEGHYVDTFDNGQIKVAGVDFWCTSEKWYDAKKKKKGVGLKNFKDYLKTL